MEIGSFLSTKNISLVIIGIIFFLVFVGVLFYDQKTSMKAMEDRLEKEAKNKKEKQQDNNKAE